MFVFDLLSRNVGLKSFLAKVLVLSQNISTQRNSKKMSSDAGIMTKLEAFSCYLCPLAVIKTQIKAPLKYYDPKY